MMDDSKDLFNGFKPQSADEWRSIAKADLKGAGFDTLIWKTYEGIAVQPFYTQNDIEKLDLPEENHPNGWHTYQEILIEDAEETNRRALKAISFDVHGLLFNVNRIIDIKKLLTGIDPTEIKVSFKGGSASEATADYFEYLKEEGVDPARISGYCDHDVLSQWITKDADLDFKGLAKLIRLTSSAPDFKALHISSGDFINAGSNFTQELGYTLNKVVEYIDKLTDLGITVGEVIQNMHFEFSITTDFFFEIAKLRAFRSLIGSVLNTYGIEDYSIPLMATGSLWSKSRHDYHVNMIRNTTEAMSAVLGGADEILISAHDDLYASSSVFGQRIATNISNLLREESHLDKVNNPVAGTYYVESITSRLSKEALNLFKETEKAGGLITSIRSGEVQSEIRGIREMKEKDFLDENFIMVGTNKFLPEDQDQLQTPPTHKSLGADGRELLFPRSLAEVQDTKSS